MSQYIQHYKAYDWDKLDMLKKIKYIYKYFKNDNEWCKIIITHILRSLRIMNNEKDGN